MQVRLAEERDFESVTRLLMELGRPAVTAHAVYNHVGMKNSGYWF